MIVRTLSLAFVLLSLVFGALGQSSDRSSKRFDLTGVWDLAKGSFEHPLADLAVRRINKRDISKLRISHEGDEISILPLVDDPDLASQIVPYKYYTDGRGESNPRGSQIVSKTKTSWKKGKVITKGGDHGPNQSFQAFTKEWTLSADGQTLTVTTEYSATTYINGRESFSLASRPKVVEVYKRQP